MVTVLTVRGVNSNMPKRKSFINISIESKRESSASLPEQPNIILEKKTSNSESSFFSYRDAIKRMTSGSSMDQPAQRPRLRTFSLLPTLNKEAEEDCLALSKTLSEFYSEITKLPRGELQAFLSQSDWGKDEVRSRLMTA